MTLRHVLEPIYYLKILRLLVKGVNENTSSWDVFSNILLDIIKP